MIINGQRSHLGLRLYQRQDREPQHAAPATCPPRESAEPGYEVVWYPHRDAPSLQEYVRAGWLTADDRQKG